ncbi:MAG: hypothetical protein JO267_09180 [Alphaproteobacteria bacterium]|nr:hypothetical protein [Alphaproteobacteria bacterium]
MRHLLAVAVIAPLVAACTATIPVKDDFGTSALLPNGDIPPEYAEFNTYDPRMNALLADQICATPYTLLQEKNVAATPGQIAVWRGRCQTHFPSLGLW